jgi:mannose-6-phosphate isomerase-like protein (cupin superfamily)
MSLLEESVQFDLLAETLANNLFRRVLYTTQQMQVVAMCLQPLKLIYPETHLYTTQMFTVAAGSALFIVHEAATLLTAGQSLIVPAGALHTVLNPSETEPLRLWTMYAPPEHAPGVKQP